MPINSGKVSQKCHSKSLLRHPPHPREGMHPNGGVYCFCLPHCGHDGPSRKSIGTVSTAVPGHACTQKGQAVLPALMSISCPAAMMSCALLVVSCSISSSRFEASVAVFSRFIASVALRQLLSPSAGFWASKKHPAGCLIAIKTLYERDRLFDSLGKIRRFLHQAVLAEIF